jgi:hypothetical protein
MLAGCNIMLRFVTTSHFDSLLGTILVALLTKLKNCIAVSDIVKNFNSGM